MLQVQGVGFLYPSSFTGGPVCLLPLNIFDKFCQLSIGQVAKRKGGGGSSC